MARIGRSICRTLLVVAALAFVPAAVAAEFTYVSGNGTPPGRDALNEYSTDGGLTWQPAYIVAGHYLYSKLPGSEWISVSASMSTPVAQTRYRRSFDLPAGCQGPSLSVRIHVDNAATVSLNGTQFGSTPAVEQVFTFQDPAEGPYTTAGPFLATGNVLEFGVRNFTSITALNYKAVLTCALDAAPPVVSCTAPDGLWHADNVTIACTASDEGSGLADPADASFTLSTSVAAGEENANADTGSRQVCDANGNCATAGPVGGIKIDRLAPTLTLPSNAVVNATSPAGAAGDFAVSAQDGADPAPTVACEPSASGTFPIGLTEVRCTATDHVGNRSSGSFTVRVKGAAEQIADLIDKLGRLFGDRAEKVQKPLDKTERADKACKSLDQFAKKIDKEHKTDLSDADRADLIADATRIRAVIGCA